MVAKSPPDWLPAGWSVQFSSDRKQGLLKTVSYTHLESGKKFFSKGGAMRHIKTASTQGDAHQSTITNIKNPLKRNPLQLVGKTDEYPEWLPDGWKIELRTRKSGSQVGRAYKCYIDPSSDYTFYSKPQVFQYLKTVKRKICKSRNHKLVNHKRCIIKKKTATAVQMPSKVVIEKHNADDLPPGWIVEIKVSKVRNRVRRDPYYKDPESGYVFRSKKDALHFIETGEISKHAIKPKCTGDNDLKLVNDEIAASPSSATKKQKLKHPITGRLLSEETKNAEMSSIELPETESFKIQDQKGSTERIVASAPTTEVVLAKPLTENLFEKCAKSEGDCSRSRSSQPKAQLSDKRVGLRSSQPKAELSGKREGLRTSQPKAQLSGKREGLRSSQPKAELSDKHEARRSRLQDKRVSAEGRVALTPTTKTIPQKQITDSLVEGCAKTKEDCPPSTPSQTKHEELERRVRTRSLQPIDEQLSIAEVGVSSTVPGKIIFSVNKNALPPAADNLDMKNSLKTPTKKSNVQKVKIDSSKSKTKEKPKLPHRSSKRLAGLQPEPVNDLISSSEQALRVAVRKSSKSGASIDAGLASDGSVNRATQQIGAVSKAEADSALLRDKLGKFKRSVDGLELEPVDILVSSEQALQVTRTSGVGDASRDASLASDDYLNGASQQLRAASEPNVAGHTLSNRNSALRGELLSNGKMLLDDQVIPKDHHKQETDRINSEKPEPELRFLFGSDPCLEFAFKTLTGELPVAHAVDNEPGSETAGDMLQKENSLGKGSSKRKTRAVSNKSKKNKELMLPCRSSKRLAVNGSEPLVQPLSNKQAPQNATAKFCRSKPIPAMDMAHEASQQLEVGEDMKVAVHPCTVSHSVHESTKLSKMSLENQANPEEKLQKFEIEKAAVQNPQPQFSYPFADTWSDPCLDFAFKTLTGEIPIEDDLFQGYFGENHDSSHNQRDSMALPDFGSPSFFQSDISPQFNAPDQSVSGQLLPTNSSLPPAGNVSLSNRNGVVFGQQLSMNSPFPPAGNVNLSNGSPFVPGQQLSTNSSFPSAGNTNLSNGNPFVPGQQLSMNSSFPPAGNTNLPIGSPFFPGQQLSMNSSFPPAGNMNLPNDGPFGLCPQISLNSLFPPAGNTNLSNGTLFGQSQQLSNGNNIGAQKPCLGG